ncbi:MAG: hypothetical protein QM705_01850 [Ancrocorticia sp.]
MRRRCVVRCVSAATMASALVLTLASCGSEPESSSESTAAPAITDSSFAPQVDDEPRDDLTNEHVVEWDHLEVFSETSIRVKFWVGSDRCYGTRAVVEETDTTIAIAAIEGLLPDAPQECTKEARGASLLVETKSPIGDREIIPLLDPQGLK